VAFWGFSKIVALISVVGLLIFSIKCTKFPLFLKLAAAQAQASPLRNLIETEPTKKAQLFSAESEFAELDWFWDGCWPLPPPPPLLVLASPSLSKISHNQNKLLKTSPRYNYYTHNAY
jgi:hypothetical protein